MAFLDKIGGMAKNIGDKANDAIETTKLNSKINSEKAAISECMQRIGEYYFKKYQAGEGGDPGVAEYYAAIEKHLKTIDETQDGIADIKSDVTTRLNDAAPQAAAPSGRGGFCPACGAQITGTSNFCGACGYKFA